MGSVFLPLQRCKRKRVEEENPVEVAKGSGNFNVFKGRTVQDPVEVAKKMTVSGWFFNLVSRLHWV